METCLTWQPEPSVGEWVGRMGGTGVSSADMLLGALSGGHWELGSLEASEVILHLLGILGSN